MDKIKTDKFLNIIAFIAIMQEQLDSKSPEYILEKYERYCESEQSVYNWGLDIRNRGKIEKYVKQWHKQIKSVTSDPDKLDETKPMGEVIAKGLSDDDDNTTTDGIFHAIQNFKIKYRVTSKIWQPKTK